MLRSLLLLTLFCALDLGCAARAAGTGGRDAGASGGDDDRDDGRGDDDGSDDDGSDDDGSDDPDDKSNNDVEGDDGGASNDDHVETTTIDVGEVRQLDLLFVIDNSLSMADKQELLSLALPDMVSRFIDPVCVSADGTQVAQPPAADTCPAGSHREFAPIGDVHLAVITTSLGGYGSPIDCVYDEDRPHTIQRVDMAHLLGSLPRGGSNSPGFLTWTAGDSTDPVIADFVNQVRAAGEFGCGWEASLESWVRFLVDPYPYVSVERQNCPFGGDTSQSCIGPQLADDGKVMVDATIVNQRVQFLRPHSLLSIVMLSDENDCSFRASGQSWRLAQAFNEDGTLNAAFRGSAACEADPNDACCHSCGAQPPSDCPTAQDASSGATVGAGCETARKYPSASETGLPSDDAVNLRCFQQKRRFGVDYLYPIQRYVNALMLPTICPFADDLDPDSDLCATEDSFGPASLVTPNPLYEDLSFEERYAVDPLTAFRVAPRPRERIFLGGILGVPWQDLAVTVKGVLDAEAPLVYRHNRQAVDDDDAVIDWRLILGDKEPATGIPNPKDTLMVESVDPRTGAVPATDEKVSPPDSPLMANSVNGHEWSNLERSDLQYACIFPIDALIPEAERTCLTEADERERLASGEAVPYCECTSNYLEEQHNPLCQNSDGSYGLVQHYSKAYPSIRQLQVLRAFGDNSIVASICPKELENQQAADFGYRPAMSALVDRFKEQLPAP